jgi:predicted MFS family arabinose efflux permease
VYQFSTGTIGLCYLAGGIGNTSGSIFAGAISDRLYAKATTKNGDIAVKEFRLRPIYIGVPLIAAGAVMYGWFLDAHIHWIGPLVGYTMSKCCVLN